MKRKKEEIAELCGQFLMNFVNAETPAEAYRGLVNSVREAFGFRVPGPRNQLSRPKMHPHIEKSRTILKDLFSDLYKGKSLRESEAFKFYEYCHEEDRRVRVDVLDDD